MSKYHSGPRAVREPDPPLLVVLLGCLLPAFVAMIFAAELLRVGRLPPYPAAALAVLYAACVVPAGLAYVRVVRHRWLLVNPLAFIAAWPVYLAGALLSDEPPAD